MWWALESQSSQSRDPTRFFCPSVAKGLAQAHHDGKDRREVLTSRTVQVGDAEDVGGAAHGAAAGAGAESSLAVHESALAWDGGRECAGGASEGDDDGGEVHFHQKVLKGRVEMSDQGRIRKGLRLIDGREAVWKRWCFEDVCDREENTNTSRESRLLSLYLLPPKGGAQPASRPPS